MLYLMKNRSSPSLYKVCLNIKKCENNNSAITIFLVTLHIQYYLQDYNSEVA